MRGGEERSKVGVGGEGGERCSIEGRLEKIVEYTKKRKCEKYVED